MLANRELSRVLLEDGRLRPRPEWLRDVFPARPDRNGVSFLPRDRLMTEVEQQTALDCFAQVVRTGEFTSGPAVPMFEAELALFTGLSNVVATSSGTDALIIALRALDIGSGDEVIIPANSFAATENAVLAVGAVPVLADVEEAGYNVDPADVAKKVTQRTRALLPVHLYGKLADMVGLQEIARTHGLALIEDACQAIGATGVGEFSDAAVLSFNPFKNFGVCGKAGAVLTNNPAVAARCRSIAYHGFAPDQKNVKVEPCGYNSRIDNTFAAIALGLLPHLALNNLRRAYLAHRYIEQLGDLVARERLSVPEPSEDNVWHLFPVQALGRDARNTLRRRLADCGVETDLYYPVLTHQQQIGAHSWVSPEIELPVTERLHSRLLHIPLHNTLSMAEQDRVIGALHAALH
jgi:3-dehydro-glucose-6-phosphate--glutamate transaminase